MKRKLTLLLISLISTIMILFAALELSVRCCTGRSVVISQIESGNPFSINSDRFYLIRETGSGKRLVRNAKVKILNHSLTHRDVSINTNSSGFRYSELAEQKPTNEKRILFLGDSVTLNNFLPEEETFTFLAEKIINRENSQTEIKLINAGVEDIGINEELEILKEEGLSIEPDIVILGFYLNDSRPPWGFDEELGHPGFIRRHSFAAEWIYKRFRLSRWFQNTGKDRMRWINDQFKYKWWLTEDEFRNLAKSAAFDWGAAWEGDLWEVVNSKLNELRYLSLQYKFNVAVVVFPVEFQTRTNFVDDLPQKTLAEISGDYDFEFLDLLPALRNAYSTNHKLDKEIYLDQAHLTSLGNEVVSQEIARFLSEIMSKAPR